MCRDIGNLRTDAPDLAPVAQPGEILFTGLNHVRLCCRRRDLVRLDDFRRLFTALRRRPRFGDDGSCLGQPNLMKYQQEPRWPYATTETLQRRATVAAPIHHLIPRAPKPVGPYSHVVEADGWLFVTGQLATDPDDDSLPLPKGIEAQTRKVMDNLQRALAGVGAGFEHVVCVRIFLTDFERDYAALNRVYTEYFEPSRLPARTTVGVTHLARGGIVEIDLIARRS